MNIFITGEEGCIAKCIALFFRSNGHIIVNDKLSKSLKTFQSKIPEFYFTNKLKEVDICNRYILDKIFRKYNIDIVIHTAAVVNTDKCNINIEHTYESNVTGTFNIIDIFNRYCKDALFVNFSTTATMDISEYSKHNLINENTLRNPDTFYGKTKYAAECIVKSNINKWINFLPIFGYYIYPFDNSSNIVKIMYHLFRMYKKEELVLTVDANNYKNYFWNKDLCQLAYYCIIQTIKENKYNEDYVLCNSQEYKLSYNSIMNRILEFLYSIKYKSALEKIRVYDQYNTIKLDGNKDYLHDHIGSNNKIMNFLNMRNSFQFKQFDECLDLIYKSFNYYY